MSLENKEIAQYVELGARSQSRFITSITSEDGKVTEVAFKWRPNKEYEYNMSVSDSFDKIPAVAVAWLIAQPEQRDKMKEAGVKVPSTHIRVFDHWLDVNTIFHAMKDFYENLTVEQVSKLNINFREFSNEITKASGNKDGQETVSTFPADESEQVAEDKTA